MKNLIFAKHFLIFCTSKLDQQVRLLKAIFSIASKKWNRPLYNVVLKRGASALSIEASGAVSVIEKEQPLAEYSHCRNHILNLAISYTCKNQSIKKFLDNLTSVCIFLKIRQNGKNILNAL